MKPIIIGGIIALAFTLIGIVSYQLYAPQSLTIAEINSPPPTVELMFDPVAISTESGTQHSLTLYASSPNATLVTGADITINYDPNIIDNLSVTPESLKTVLSQPKLNNGKLSFAYGLAVTENSDKVCPMNVDSENSGSCYSHQSNSCVDYTNTCSLANVCTNPFTPCTNNSPESIDLPIATINYHVKDNLSGSLESQISVDHSTSQISLRTSDINALSGTSIIHTLRIIPKTVVTVTPLPGDLNNDDSIDLLDFNLVVLGYGNTYNLLDFNKVVANYGTKR